MRVLLDVFLVVLPAATLCLDCAHFIRPWQQRRLHDDRIEYNRLRC
jgi:hypothetical protein